MATQAEIEAAAKAYRECNSSDLVKMSVALEAAERARWQPIETAPKDTRILLWLVAERQSAAVSGQISSYEDGKIWNGHSYQPNLATHWQPLPSRPESK